VTVLVNVKVAGPNGVLGSLRASVIGDPVSRNDSSPTSITPGSMRGAGTGRSR
jgi:hypothetical protein